MAKVRNYTSEIMQKITSGDWTSAQSIREDALNTMTDSITKAISGYSYSDYNILADALNIVSDKIRNIANTTGGI